MEKWSPRKITDIFSTPVFSLKRMECHHPEKNVDHDFYLLSTLDWINVVALTEDGEIILVRQHRLGTNELTLETPGGLVERGESPESTAIRELCEETGYFPDRITLMKKLAANPAIQDNHIYFYLAENCRKTGEQDLDKDEDIEVALFERDQVRAMIRSGGIDHSIAVTALSLYFLMD